MARRLEDYIPGLKESGVNTDEAVSFGGTVAFGANPTLGSGTKLALNSGSATATAGAATANVQVSTITSEALTTAAGATYTLTLTNSLIVAGSRVFVNVGNGTNTAGEPGVLTVTPAGGSVEIVIKNHHAANAFNGTLKIYVLPFN